MIKITVIALLILAAASQQWLEPDSTEEDNSPSPLLEEQQAPKPQKHNQQQTPQAPKQEPTPPKTEENPPSDKSDESPVQQQDFNPFSQSHRRPEKPKGRVPFDEKDKGMEGGKNGARRQKRMPPGMDTREASQFSRRDRNGNHNFPKSQQFEENHPNHYNNSNEPWIQFTPELCFLIAFASTGLVCLCCMKKGSRYTNPTARRMMRRIQPRNPVSQIPSQHPAAQVPNGAIQNQIRYHQMQIERLSWQSRGRQPITGDRMMDYESSF